LSLLAHRHEPAPSPASLVGMSDDVALDDAVPGLPSSPRGVSAASPSTLPSSSSDPKNTLRLSVHMPTRPMLLKKPASLTVLRTASVADVKAQLSLWEGRPRQDLMKVIFSGRILADHERLVDVIGPNVSPFYYRLLHPGN
jgi:hypothetical protein